MVTLRIHFVLVCPALSNQCLHGAHHILITKRKKNKKEALDCSKWDKQAANESLV